MQSFLRTNFLYFSSVFLFIFMVIRVIMGANPFFQCLLGIQCKDFVMIAADQTFANSVIVMKHDDCKLYEISDRLLMGVVGESGEGVQFMQYVDKNFQLYSVKNGYELSTAAAVHFARNALSERRLNMTQTMVNLLIGGYDETEGGRMYSLDYLGSSVKVPFAVHGLGGMLSLGILDRNYNPNLTPHAAYDILKLCVAEIHERLFVNLPNFLVKMVGGSGVREMPVICPATFLNKK